MDSYIFIGRDECGNPKIRVDYKGADFPPRLYMFYTEREAIKRYREEFNLAGKHLIRIDMGVSSCYY